MDPGVLSELPKINRYPEFFLKQEPGPEPPSGYSPHRVLVVSPIQKNRFLHMNRPRITEMITENTKISSKARGVSLRGRSATFMP